MERIDLKITNPEVILLRAQLAKERELRSEAETLADVYGAMATAGGLLTTLLMIIILLIAG